MNRVFKIFKSVARFCLFFQIAFIIAMIILFSICITIGFIYGFFQDTFFRTIMSGIFVGCVCGYGLRKYVTEIKPLNLGFIESLKRLVF